MYRTPYTPSTATASPVDSQQVSRGAYGDNVVNTRKRSRSDYFTSRSPSIPHQHIHNSVHSPSQGDERYHHSKHQQQPISPDSPPPLSNSRYQLRNGLDTPGLASLDSVTTPLGQTQDPIFRRQLAATPSPSLDSYTHLNNPSALSREQSGAPRRMVSSKSSDSPSWGAFAWKLAAGTASAVWNFCGSVGFSGFRAGGGQAYRLSGQAPTLIDEQPSECKTSIPGDWPDEGEYIQVNAADLPEERPAKRRQVTQSEWVLVHGQRPSPTPLQSRGAYTNALQPRVTSSSSDPRGRRSASRSLLPRPLGERRNSRASSAGSRANSSSYVPVTALGSPGERPRASVASMRSPHSSPQTHVEHQHSRQPSMSCKGSTGSPKKKTPPKPQDLVDPYDINNPGTSFASHTHTPSSAEAISKFQRKQERAEKKQDATYRKMNQQLEDLISQGRAALASSVEIAQEYEMTDEEDSGVDMSFEEENARWKRHARGASSASLGRMRRTGEFLQ